MSPLQQATLDELIAELRVRFSACIFAGVADAPGEGSNELWFLDYNGGPTACLGVATRSVQTISRQIEENRRPLDMEEQP